MADAGDFRALLGRFPSGVAVVTVDRGGQRLGLTLGTLVGLSLDPPLVAFSVARQAALHELLREAGRCTISLLAAGQEALAEHFARGVPPIVMWQGIDATDGPRGPLLAEAVAWLECETVAEHDAGDHTLFLGRVERAERGREAPPLLRLWGEYRSA